MAGCFLFGQPGCSGQSADHSLVGYSTAAGQSAGLSRLHIRLEPEPAVVVVSWLGALPLFFFYYKKIPPDFQACHFFTFVGCHFEERRCTPRLHLKQPPEPEGPPDSHGTGAHAARAVIQRVYLKEVCSAATRAAIRPCLRGFWRVNHRAPMCVHSTAFYISMICNTTLGMQTFLKSI